MSDAPTQTAQAMADYLTVAHDDRSTYLLDCATSFPLWQEAAEAGATDGCFLVAKCHDLGVNVPQDTVVAMQWYRRGAEGGSWRCQLNLGMLVRRVGKWSDQANGEAHGWFLRAAEQGSAAAHFLLGLNFLRGQGASRDLARARAHAREAELAAHTASQPDLPHLVKKLLATIDAAERNARRRRATSE